MLKEKSSAKKIQIIFDLNFAIYEKQKRIDGGVLRPSAAVVFNSDKTNAEWLRTEFVCRRWVVETTTRENRSSSI